VVGQKLLKTFGPALGVLMDNNNNEATTFDESTLFTDLAMTLCLRLDDLDLVATLKKLFENSYVTNGEGGHDPLDFDEHFSANFGNLMAVTEFALKENFGDFFTSYLSAKGLEINTLREMVSQKVSNLPVSED
jgi:hypothetical protein